MKALPVQYYFFTEDHFDRELLAVFKVPTLGSFGIINLSISFWIQSFILLSLQSVANLFVAAIVYTFIIGRSPSTSLPLLDQSPSRSFILGYGLVCPILLIAPFYIVTHCVEFNNVTFIICLCGAFPNLLLLRVIEAVHGLVPPAFVLTGVDLAATAKTKTCDQGENGSDSVKERGGMKNDKQKTYIGFKRFLLYYAATLQVKIDEKSNQPVPFTRQIMVAKLKNFLRVFLQTSVLYSLLQSFDYAVAPSRLPIQTIMDIYYWGNIVNAFLMASLTSLLLEGGASGLGLITSFCSGLTMEDFSASPLSQSSSPSDFWGNRWDRPVASALRRGAYRPLLQAGFSRLFAAIVTFAVSGFIHEYILLLMAKRKFMPRKDEANSGSADEKFYEPELGNQFLFFLWNGVVLCLERLVVSTEQGRSFTKWMRYHMPKPLRTALVLLTVLPIAHLFTDEYVKSSFYDDAAHGFPRIKYLGNSSFSNFHS